MKIFHTFKNLLFFFFHKQAVKTMPKAKKQEVEFPYCTELNPIDRLPCSPTPHSPFLPKTTVIANADKLNSRQNTELNLIEFQTQNKMSIWFHINSRNVNEYKRNTLRINWKKRKWRYEFQYIVAAFIIES